MAFLDQWKLAMCTTVGGNCIQADVDDTVPFRARVELAMVKVATQVQGEPIGTLTARQWTKRATLATNVLSVQTFENGTCLPGSQIWLDTFCLAVTTNATITAASTDADIEFQVTAVWDDVAGVTGNDLN